MIFILVLLLILNLEYNINFYFYFIFLFWRSFLNTDFIILSIFFYRPHFWINKYRSLTVPKTDHHHPLIYKHIDTDLPQSHFFWDKFLFLYNFFHINLTYIWQPIFKKHSYFMYFRSNRDFWLINKIK